MQLVGVGDRGQVISEKDVGGDRKRASAVPREDGAEGQFFSCRGEGRAGEADGLSLIQSLQLLFRYYGNC